jgi:hypothetical protein
MEAITIISLAQKCDVTKIEIFKDFMLVLGWLSCSLQVSNIHHQVSVRRIGDMDSNFENIYFSHVYKEEKIEAKSLAKEMVKMGF